MKIDKARHHSSAVSSYGPQVGTSILMSNLPLRMLEYLNRMPSIEYLPFQLVQLSPIYDDWPSRGYDSQVTSDFLNIWSKAYCLLLFIKFRIQSRLVVFFPMLRDIGVFFNERWDC